ncbi:MAG: hypothetical protein ACI9BW_003706, partial [Gammaproteobacteria bacterium]
MLSGMPLHAKDRIFPPGKSHSSFQHRVVPRSKLAIGTILRR